MNEDEPRYNASGVGNERLEATFHAKLLSAVVALNDEKLRTIRLHGVNGEGATRGAVAGSDHLILRENSDENKDKDVDDDECEPV
jgi:hypothetical protein